VKSVKVKLPGISTGSGHADPEIGAFVKFTTELMQVTF
jgi:hypothetical protein